VGHAGDPFVDGRGADVDDLPPLAFMYGNTAFMQLNWPRTLISMTFMNSWGVHSVNGFSTMLPKMAALLRRMSTEPNFSAAALAMASHCSWLLTSVLM